MVMRMREVFSSSWVALHTSQEACVVLLLEKPEVLLRASSPCENNLPFRGVAGRLRLVRAGIMAPTHPDYLHLWFLAWSYRKVTLQTDAVETKITNPYTRATTHGSPTGNKVFYQPRSEEIFYLLLSEASWCRPTTRGWQNIIFS